MEGVFAQLKYGKEIRAILEEAQQQINDQFGHNIRITINKYSTELYIDAIVKLVSEEMQVTMNLMLGVSRKANIVAARHISMALCINQVPEVTLAKVADYFGKDHTSVIHAVKSIEDKLSVHDEYITTHYNNCYNSLQKKRND